MNRTTTAPLRAACEPCRAQKLRCIPASERDSGTPCQRCVSAKVPKLCVFGPRSRKGRTGRYGKSYDNVESWSGMPRKDKEFSMPALPGMSIFSLSSFSSPSSEVETPDSLGSLLTMHTPQIPNRNDNTIAVECAPEGTISDFWQHDTSVLDSFSLDAFLQQPSNLLFGDGITASMKTSYSIDSSSRAKLPDFSLSHSNTRRSDSDVDMDKLTEESPGPLVDLTALLAEMSPYENRLSKLSDGELHNYPIGDALFFSHRFYAILSDYSHFHSTNPTSQLSTPTMLLVLSCFMTLTRIYSPIFGHLHQHLLRMLEARSAYESRSCAFPSIGANIHSYRGLRLSQLQSICLCTGWHPMKKAVSMLLSSLGGVEGWLGLPPDIRIMAIIGAEARGEQTSRLKGIGGAKTVLFEEGTMAALTNGRLYKSMRKQAQVLRGKIEEVEELLKGVTDIACVPPKLGKG